MNIMRKRIQLTSMALLIMAGCATATTISYPVYAEETQQGTSDAENNQEVYTEGHFSYTLQGDKATIVKYNGPDEKTEEFHIPAQLGNYKVIAIGERAFAESNIRNIIVEDGIESIGVCAFGASARSITIPASVTDISNVMMQTWVFLEEIVVDENNQHYKTQDNVLFNKDMTELIFCAGGSHKGNYIIPDSVTNIKAGAFYECFYITSMVIPDSVKSIGNNAFFHTGIENIVIPASVEYLADIGFAGCHELKSVYYMGNAPTYEEGFTLMSDDFTTYYIKGTSGWDQIQWNGYESKVFDGIIVPGDVNYDSIVDLSDAQAILKYSLKIATPDSLQKQAGDVDSNGTVDLSDAQQVLKKALKIEK